MYNMYILIYNNKNIQNRQHKVAYMIKFANNNRCNICLLSLLKLDKRYAAESITPSSVAKALICYLHLLEYSLLIIYLIIETRPNYVHLYELFCIFGACQKGVILDST